MKKNMGTAGIAIRVVIAVIFAVLYFFKCCDRDIGSHSACYRGRLAPDKPFQILPIVHHFWNIDLFGREEADIVFYCFRRLSPCHFWSDC